MSINWVMLSPSGDPEPFVKLPNERILHTSPSRTSLALKTISSLSGSAPFSVNSSAGKAYLTNQRLIYIPKDAKSDLMSFCAPILNIQDAHVRSPMFGANYWNAHVKPVPGGNIPSNVPYLELKMVFSDGGAFDHQTAFEQVKERAAHALEIARETRGQNLDMGNVHLEQLPAYEPASGDYVSAETVVGSGVEVRSPSPGPKPSDPPPGYEEVQAQAVGTAVDARLLADAESSHAV